MTVGSHNTVLSLVHASDEVDGVVVLTLSHPPANTLSNALVSELTAELVTLATGPNAPAVVLTGVGGRFFCAGGDMKEAVDFDANVMVERMAGFHALLCALENYPRPLVCAVNGWCVGGGIEMACDRGGGCALSSGEAACRIRSTEAGPALGYDRLARRRAASRHTG